jgi:hypothetical protein
VIGIDGDGDWGRQAETALASAGLEPRRWVSARAGIEYDSNVVLLGQGVPQPRTISGQSDGRGVWFLEGGAELFRAGDWSGGILADYAGNAHFDLHEFDTQYPSGGVWVDRNLGRDSLLRANYNVGYAWVDYSSFLFDQSAALSFFHNWGAAGNTSLSVGWDGNDFLFVIFQPPTATGGSCSGFETCAPEGFDAESARNRDGNGLHVGLAHRYDGLLRQNDIIRGISIHGDFDYYRYWAKGTDWDFQDFAVQLGFLAHLPWELGLEIAGFYTYRPFDNVSSYPEDLPPATGTPYTLGPDTRTDHIGQVLVELERPIFDWLTVSARYWYTRNASNIVYFDFDRNVVGGYFTLAY